MVSIHKESHSRSDNSLYIVSLPIRGVPVEEYQSLPKFGVCLASSAAGAISHFVFGRADCGNSLSRQSAALIVSHFKRSRPDNYAYVVPEVASVDGKRLSWADRCRFRELAFAQELAHIHNGSPSDYLSEAHHLINLASVRL